MSKRLVHIKALLFFGQVDEAEDLLDICNLDIEEIGSHQLRGSGKLTTLRGRVDKMFQLLATVKEVLGKTEEEQSYYISNPTLEKEEHTLGIIINNVRAIREIDVLLMDNNSALADGKTDGISEKLVRCRELLGTIQRAGKKEVTAKYNALFDEQQRQLKQLMTGKQSASFQQEKVERSATDTNRVPQYVNQKEYKATILALIERLETIQQSYNDGDYDSCETNLEIAYYMLDELHVDDGNTALIKQQLNQWREWIEDLDD